MLNYYELGRNVLSSFPLGVKLCVTEFNVLGMKVLSRVKMGFVVCLFFSQE